MIRYKIMYKTHLANFEIQVYKFDKYYEKLQLK